MHVYSCVVWSAFVYCAAWCVQFSEFNVRWSVFSAVHIFIGENIQYAVLLPVHPSVYRVQCSLYSINICV